MVLSGFLRGSLPAGSAGPPGALGSVPLGLLGSGPLAPLNVQAQVHHVTFDLFARLLRRETAMDGLGLLPHRTGGLSINDQSINQ